MRLIICLAAVAATMAVYAATGASLHLKTQASRDYVRLTAYAPEAHDTAAAWIDCPEVYRTSEYQSERRQHVFEWRVKACHIANLDGACTCDAGVVLGLRGEIVARYETTFMVPF